MDRAIVVISDCHLSAGRIFEGKLNPHEDFYFDHEMVEFLQYFSSGKYGTQPNGEPVQVELLINGDFFDYLNVPYQGEFEEVITEEIALYKTEKIIAGHPRVMQGLKQFAACPGKTIKYLIGNHDADLFFPKVQERITREWDPQGEYPSSRVEVVADRDRLTYPGGVEVHHGNQFEAVHVLNFEKPLLTQSLAEPVLNIPWGSFFVLKIINRLRHERDYIDKIRPIKAFVLFGLVFDPIFTFKFCFFCAFYFLKTRFVYNPARRSSLKVTADILRQETDFLLDLEKQARKHLDTHEGLQTVIFGHTHKPMNRIFPDGKQYLNTGTWTKMVNLDFRNLGQQYCLTFALIQISDGKAQCDLRHWVGEAHPHRTYHG
jgi:UDP-2,3-diacylglucosamine pyrophosphatase LpxH